MAPVASRVVVKIFSQDSVLQRFVEQIIDEDMVEEIFKVFSQDSEWVHQRFVEQNHEAAWRGAVLRREEAHEVPRKPGHRFHEPFCWQSLALMIIRQSTEAFDFLRFSVIVDPDPEVVSPSARGKLDFKEPLVSDSSLPLRQSTKVLKNFTIFHVNANSDPEVLTSSSFSGGWRRCFFFAILKGVFGTPSTWTFGR